MQKQHNKYKTKIIKQSTKLLAQYIYNLLSATTITKPKMLFLVVFTVIPKQFDELFVKVFLLKSLFLKR